MSKAEEKALKVYPILKGSGITTYSLNKRNELLREGYEQAEKDTIERACEWLFSHLPILVDYYDEDIHTNADRSEFIKLFRTQMEEQK